MRSEAAVAVALFAIQASLHAVIGRVTSLTLPFPLFKVLAVCLCSVLLGSGIRAALPGRPALGLAVWWLATLCAAATVELFSRPGAGLGAWETLSASFPLWVVSVSFALPLRARLTLRPGAAPSAVD
jgi:hypothetical protein